MTSPLLLQQLACCRNPRDDQGVISTPTDPAHLVPSAGAFGGRAVWNSPAKRATPRRDDSALGQGVMGGWLSRTQGKAAALAANVTRKASDVIEQWSEAQLSSKIIMPQ